MPTAAADAATMWHHPPPYTPLVAGNGVVGNGVAEPETAATNMDVAGNGVVGNGVAGNGVAGNGVAGNGVVGNGVVGNVCEPEIPLLTSRYSRSRPDAQRMINYCTEMFWNRQGYQRVDVAAQIQKCISIEEATKHSQL